MDYHHLPTEPTRTVQPVYSAEGRSETVRRSHGDVLQDETGKGFLVYFVSEASALTGISQTASKASDDDAAPGANRCVRMDDHETRLNLLAQKYGDNAFTPEDRARLTIVTERLRKAVYAADLKNLSDLASVVEEVAAGASVLERLERDYGST